MIPPAEILLLTYSFAHTLSFKQITVQCLMGNGPITENIICYWFSYCREVCMLSMEDKYANRGKIGGPNHVVQID